jgi:hypothetical protein
MNLSWVAFADRRQTIRCHQCPHFSRPDGQLKSRSLSSRLPAQPRTSYRSSQLPRLPLLSHYPSHLCNLRPLIDTHDPLNIFPSRSYSSATTVDPVYALSCAANLNEVIPEAPWPTIQVRACLLLLSSAKLSTSKILTYLQRRRH